MLLKIIHFFLSLHQLQDFQGQRWKKLHTVHADISFRIEDILIKKSRKYVAIMDLFSVFLCSIDYFDKGTRISNGC